MGAGKDFTNFMQSLSGNRDLNLTADSYRKDTSLNSKVLMRVTAPPFDKGRWATPKALVGGMEPQTCSGNLANRVRETVR